MKYTITAIILSIYSLLGFIMCLLTPFTDQLYALLCFSLFSILPACGAYGAMKRIPSILLVTGCYFITQILNFNDDSKILPFIKPITISVPVGDFAKGSGVLIDFFALFMAAYLFTLVKHLFVNKNALKKTIKKNRH